MNILGILFLLVMFSFIGSAYYLMAKISYAVWFPNRVGGKWTNIAEYPPVQLFLPLFKWVIPVWLALSLFYILAATAEYLLTNAA